MGVCCSKFREVNDIKFLEPYDILATAHSGGRIIFWEIYHATAFKYFRPKFE